MLWALKLSAMTFWTKPYYTSVAIQVSPKQGGMIYMSHFWFVCRHRACVTLRGWGGVGVGGRFAAHYLPIGLIFPDHGGFEWGQWQAVGCMAIQKFLVGSFALAMKSWPVPHHPPSGTTDPPQLWAFVSKMLPTPSPHPQSLNEATQQEVTLNVSKPNCSYPQEEDSVQGKFLLLLASRINGSKLSLHEQSNIFMLALLPQSWCFSLEKY